MNLTVGGLFGYVSSKVKHSLNVPSSNGVSATFEFRGKQQQQRFRCRGVKGGGWRVIEWRRPVERWDKKGQCHGQETGLAESSRG